LDSEARAFASEEDCDRDDWLRHGTLAHRLLARADLSLCGADLEGLLYADGLDPKSPAVAEIRTRVARFLGTRFMREEVAPLQASRPGAVRRAVPFLLEVPGGPLLRGQVDLMIIDEGAGGAAPPSGT